MAAPVSGMGTLGHPTQSGAGSFDIVQPDAASGEVPGVTAGPPMPAAPTTGAATASASSGAPTLEQLEERLLQMMIIQLLSGGHWIGLVYLSPLITALKIFK